MLLTAAGAVPVSEERVDPFLAGAVLYGQTLAVPVPEACSPSFLGVVAPRRPLARAGG
jgi:hypothetical protein